MQRLQFRAMGCQMLAAIDSDDKRAIEMLTQVPDWFEEWEQSLSRFRNDSELNSLNRADGNPIRVSEIMWQVLQAAIQAAHDSDGLVTPTLFDAVRAAGYDTSFDSLELQGKLANAVPNAIGDWHAIELDAETRTVRLPRGMHLDFGGVAKGWAADETVKRLSAIAPAMMDAGGDIALSSAMSNGEPFPIAVADPFKPENDLDLLLVSGGGVATSGRDYRRWQRDGKWLHHIIDPRTGLSAETDVLSATVIAPTTVQAEVAAKVALILGSRAGLEWIETKSELAGLLVLENGRIVRSQRLNDYMWTEPIEYTVLPAWS